MSFMPHVNISELMKQAFGCAPKNSQLGGTSQQAVDKASEELAKAYSMTTSPPIVAPPDWNKTFHDKINDLAIRNVGLPDKLDFGAMQTQIQQKYEAEIRAREYEARRISAPAISDFMHKDHERVIGKINMRDENIELIDCDNFIDVETEIENHDRNSFQEKYIKVIDEVKSHNLAMERLTGKKIRVLKMESQVVDDPSTRGNMLKLRFRFWYASIDAARLPTSNDTAQVHSSVAGASQAI